jgi:hypothetical protein
MSASVCTCAKQQPDCTTAVLFGQDVNLSLLGSCSLRFARIFVIAEMAASRAVDTSLLVPQNVYPPDFVLLVDMLFGNDYLRYKNNSKL